MTTSGSAFDTPLTSEGLPFRVVGIGASAGGVDAYTRLLRALPTDTGMAYVLIPHLSPTHHSELSQILAHVTPMLVTDARDGEEFEPNHVYVVPSDRVLTAVNQRLHLSARPLKETHPTIIDEFLNSLARELGPRAIGVILSGTGTDGTRGLRAIKAHGGITYAQDFASAAHDNMPRSAVEAGVVDFTLSPEAIAESLADPAVSYQPLPQLHEGIGTLPLELPDTEAAALETIVDLLQTATGVDFRHYKRPTMARRVRRRVDALGLADLAAYVTLLREDASEIAALFSTVLIHVTGFFREPAMFDVLQTTVIPSLVATQPGSAPLRVWVVGCATGEEAYSTAIAFLEMETNLGRELSIRVFATDLSEAALATARVGRYSPDIIAQLSPERLARFFGPVDGGFQVEKRLRELCVFARHDITRDPPFALLDLVICRNLLIYLDSALQHRVLRNLHYALRPGGFLALGSAETVGGFDQLFSPLDRKHKIYLRRDVASHLDLSVNWGGPRRSPGPPQPQITGRAPIQWTTPQLQQAAAKAFFTQHPSCSVIINADLEILHFQGRTSPYLEAPSGGPTVQLLRMAHSDLRLTLGSIIRKAQRERAPVRRRGLQLKVGRRVRRVNVTVFPLPADDQAPEHHLVVFESVPREEEEGAGSGASADSSASGHGPIGDARTLELERELAETKEYLQSTMEQQDVAHVELQAAYEASLSANEEFQSTNEELESTKEELQSLNEELMTLNEMLQQGNAELSARTAEVSSLLEAVEMPILLINSDLRLRAFNSKAAAEFRLARRSLGRPLSEIQSPLPLNQLRDLVARALGDATIQEREVQDTDGRWYIMRLWPVLPVLGKESAAVLALIDIGKLKADLHHATEAREYSDAIVETVSEPLAVLDEDLRILSANQAFHDAFRSEAQKVAGKSLWEVGDGELNLPELRQRLEICQSGGSFGGALEITIESQRIGRYDFRVTGRRIVQPGSRARNILLALENVTERKKRLERESEASRMQAVGQLAGGVAHEINNQITGVLGFAKNLLDSGLGESERTDAARIIKAAQRAAEITQQLLAFGRRQTLQPVVVELNTLVTASQPLLQQLVGPNIPLELSLDHSAGSVRVDQANLEQILVNLVLNARDAMPQGGRLTIQTSSVVVTDEASTTREGGIVPRGQYARLIVSDTGAGMDDVTKARLFEPFFTTKPPGYGTGLGLASVYGTLKQSGGLIWVQSELGRGTTFTIYLPGVIASAPPKSGPAPTAGPGGSETILVVEDEEIVRDWICLLLRKLGYAPLAASDGSGALRVLEQDSEVQLVLCDVVMPGMGGIELRDHLAAIRPELPVLLMSGFATDELVRRGMVDRGTFVLQKPFEDVDLASSIRQLLDTRKPSRST